MGFEMCLQNEIHALLPHIHSFYINGTLCLSSSPSSPPCVSGQNYWPLSPWEESHGFAQWTGPHTWSLLVHTRLKHQPHFRMLLGPAVRLPLLSVVSGSLRAAPQVSNSLSWWNQIQLTAKLICPTWELCIMIILLLGDKFSMVSNSSDRKH